MIPFGKHTVTLIRKTVANGQAHFDAIVFRGCSLKRERVREKMDAGVTDSWHNVCRIPLDAGVYAGAGAGACVVPQIGDIIATGVIVAPQSANEYSSMLNNASGAFAIMRVTDNTGDGVLPHYKCEG